MSNTHHHRHQRRQHQGHDYGGRLKCNRGYGQAYGKTGRQRAARERRAESKAIIRKAVDQKV